MGKYGCMDVPGITMGKYGYVPGITMGKYGYYVLGITMGNYGYVPGITMGKYGYYVLGITMITGHVLCHQCFQSYYSD